MSAGLVVIVVVPVLVGVKFVLRGFVEREVERDSQLEVRNTTTNRNCMVEFCSVILARLVKYSLLHLSHF